jgi:hypothetical protein
MQGIAPVDQHEDRLQQMVSVRATACDVQKKIQFGRGRHIMQRFHGWIITMLGVIGAWSLGSAI